MTQNPNVGVSVQDRIEEELETQDVMQEAVTEANK